METTESAEIAERRIASPRSLCELCALCGFHLRRQPSFVKDFLVGDALGKGIVKLLAQKAK
jgi:hypothetical protein